MEAARYWSASYDNLDAVRLAVMDLPKFPIDDAASRPAGRMLLRSIPKSLDYIRKYRPSFWNGVHRVCLPAPYEVKE